MEIKKLKYYLISIVLMVFLHYFVSSPLFVGKTMEHKKLESVSYTPYGKYQNPNNFFECDSVCLKRMDSDLELLSKNFTSIRTYSTTGYDAIFPLLRKHNMKIYLGAWINNNPVDSLKEIEGIKRLAKGNEDIIQAVILGNESFLRGEMEVDTMKNYINMVRKEFPTIKITVAEVWEHWIRNSELANHVDFLMVHILPYWENHAADASSIIHIDKKIKEVKEELTLLGITKEIRIGESGYPSLGEVRDGIAVPSPVNQANFIRLFIDYVEKNDVKYNIIEAFDQPWKKGNEGIVGAFWGTYDSNRMSKGILEGVVPAPLQNHFIFVSLLFFSLVVYTLKLIKKENRNTLYFSAIFSFLVSFNFSGLLLEYDLEHYYVISSYQVFLFLGIVFVYYLFLLHNNSNQSIFLKYFG